MSGPGLFARQSTKPSDEDGALAVSDRTGAFRVEAGLSPTMSVGSSTEPVATPTPEERIKDASSRATGRMYTLNVDRLESRGSSTLRFPSRSGAAQGRGPLYCSLTALSNAASNGDAGDWLDAASVLKRDAVRLRNSASLGRHASVLLMLADALTFTTPGDPTLEPGASQAIQRGLSVLTDPYVSTEDEKSLMTDLLSRGWKVAPPFDEGLVPVG